MGSLDLVGVISVLATPLAGVLSYWAGKKKRNNDFLQDLQKSINMLSEKNSELITDLIEVKEQNVELKVALKTLTLENDKLSKQVKDLVLQLEKVKVIPKTKKN